MTGTAFALVLAPPVLHSVWNALAKRARDQVAFLWFAQTLSTVLLAPFWLGMLVVDGFPPSALPFVVATIILHALYFFTLGNAYRLGEFSLVYPIARGLGGALVPLLALFGFNERLSPLGTTGVTLVVVGIIGSLWFGEGRLGPRLLGALVILAGVACVALAR